MPVFSQNLYSYWDLQSLIFRCEKCKNHSIFFCMSWFDLIYLLAYNVISVPFTLLFLSSFFFHLYLLLSVSPSFSFSPFSPHMFYLSPSLSVSISLFLLSLSQFPFFSFILSLPPPFYLTLSYSFLLSLSPPLCFRFSERSCLGCIQRHIRRHPSSNHVSRSARYVHMFLNLF